MKLSIVLFFTQDIEEQVIGFKILPTKEANIYKKAVKLLSQNESTYSFGEQDYSWRDTTIDIKSISNAEVKTLNTIFEMDYDVGTSRAVGFIPDAIEQAQDQELMDQNGKPTSAFGEDQFGQEQDEEDYY